MINQEWKEAEARRLGFSHEQMDMLLHIAAKAYTVAMKTTYDELATHLLARVGVGRIEELQRMAVILGDDAPVPLTMWHGTCGRQASWHVHFSDRPDWFFFCPIHLPSHLAATKYAGVELCQAECVIIEKGSDD